MKRLDLALVELRLAPSRNKAQAMIEAGDVELFLDGAWRSVKRSSYTLVDISPGQIRVRAESVALKYVSRGGLKLEAALKSLKLDVTGWRCLDLGISTGGFTDCLLQHGAQHVTGYDVGHGQLSPALESEKKLQHFEGVNVRELILEQAFDLCFDLCVVDLSFISLQLVIPVLGQQLRAGTRVLALVKPQFEIGTGKKLEPRLFAEVKTQMLHAFEICGFSNLEYFACEVKGQDGNQEFFAYATRV